MRRSRIGFLERLADRLGAVATARTVYGEPVEREERTIIPVAEVRLGFGGRAGETGGWLRRRARGDGGGGGGGGAKVRPLGFITIDDEGARFERLPEGRVAFLFAALVVLLVFLWRRNRTKPEPTAVGPG